VTVAQLAASRPRVADLLDLTKPRLSLLVVLSCAVGMALAPVTPPGWGRALAAIVATGAVVGGANALNCWRERESDKWMRRTRMRPLPSGRLDPAVALAFGLTLSFGGIVGLSLIRPLSGLLATVAVATYVLLYTPMKRTSPLCTLVGAIPGALPPLIGWTAAGGALDPGAWTLFAWMFLWQPPHFLALATLYRDDYAVAGMPMFPVKHARDGTVERQTTLWIAALLPLPLALVPLSRAGTITAVATPLLGLAFLFVAWRGLKTGATTAWARSTFIASILYMGLTLLAFVLDAGSSG
jgi:protoheme IX farnesyltransferase